MNLDIKMKIGDLFFNYRVAIIIRKDNQILVQKDKRVPYYALPGGRCKAGESSIMAAIREFKEETGLDTYFKKEIGLIENFFVSSFNNQKYHELLIIHELKLAKEIEPSTIIPNIEDDKKEYLTYIWLDIDTLKKSDFRPKNVINMLDSDNFSYLVNME